MIKGTVAIVGRPNVGKSTLFNCLTHTRKSIVDDTPGVTRDQIISECFYDRDRQDGFVLVDTGGIEDQKLELSSFDSKLIWEKTKQAIDTCDLVLLMFDGKHGLHPHDHNIVKYIRTTQKPSLFLVNKIDGLEKEALSYEFYKLGFEDLISISAAHRKGMSDLLERIRASLEQASVKQNSTICSDIHKKIAIIGRPNAGKSSITNRLVGEDRTIVSEIAGTTRDSIDIDFKYNKKNYQLVDTAGIRRKTKISDFLETQSVIRSIRSINESDIIIFVIDAIHGLSDQDRKLINLATRQYKPVLLVVNKWDLIPEKTSKTQEEYKYSLQKLLLKDQSFIPVHFVSCLENKRISKIMPWVEILTQQSEQRIATSQVNKVIEELVTKQPPVIVKKFSKRIKFYYSSQIEVTPPTFIISCNLADEIKESYKRFILKTLRKKLGFDFVPIKTVVKNKAVNAKK